MRVKKRNKIITLKLLTREKGSKTVRCALLFTEFAQLVMPSIGIRVIQSRVIINWGYFEKASSSFLASLSVPDRVL